MPKETGRSPLLAPRFAAAASRWWDITERQLNELFLLCQQGEFHYILSATACNLNLLCRREELARVVRIWQPCRRQKIRIAVFVEDQLRDAIGFRRRTVVGHCGLSQGSSDLLKGYSSLTG